MDTMAKSNLERKPLIWLPGSNHSPSLREVRRELKSGTWGQKLKHRPWRNTIYWPLLCSALNYLPYTIQNHLPRDGTIQGGLNSPTSAIKKNVLIALPTVQSNGILFPNWGSLFPRDPSLCQVENTPARTVFWVPLVLSWFRLDNHMYTLCLERCCWCQLELG